MAAARLYCTNCFALLDVPLSLAPASVHCPGCRTAVDYWLFPAISRQPESPGTAAVPAADGEASCFNHPTRKAVVVCAGCGRFLCSLCDIDLTGRHYCPVCFEKKRTKGGIPLLQTTFTRYDRVALALTVFPALMCCWPVAFTAPVSLYVALRHWNSPGSEQIRVRRGLALSVALAVAALLLLALWAYLIFSPAPVPPGLTEVD